MSSYTPEAFILKNQLVVTDTTDATNGTSGAFVITGGASVSKSFIVSGDQSIGGQASINNVNVTPNLNDIIYEKQAILSSNISNFTNITGFYFLSSIASAFKAYITVIVTGPTNKYAFWEINSVYTPNGWAYTSTFTGDITGIIFNVADDSGTAKIQYKNSNGAGYSSIIRYRATTTAPAGSSPSGGQGLFNSTSNNYIQNTLLYANTPETVASASDITISNDILNIGGATTLFVSKTTDASNSSSASLVVSGGASIAKKLLVGSQVGIGTSSPAFDLDISGDINISGDIYQNGTIYSGSSLWTGTQSGDYYINPVTAKVGLNTTSPSTNLDVNGGVKTLTLTAGSILSTNASASNLSVTNVTASTVVASNITSGNVSVSNMVAANITSSHLAVTNLSFTNMTISSSLIPSANVTYDLGTPTQRWKDLYLSGNTIHLGDSVSISASTSGNVVISTASNDTPVSFTLVSSSNMYTNAMTAGSIKVNGLVSASNLAASSISIGNLVVSNNVTFNNFNATSISVSNIASDLSTIGTLNATSITTSSLSSGTISTGTILSTLSSAGSIGASGATFGTIYTNVASAGSIEVSGTVSAGSIATSNIRLTNISATNAKTIKIIKANK